MSQYLKFAILSENIFETLNLRAFAAGESSPA